MTEKAEANQPVIPPKKKRGPPQEERRHAVSGIRFLSKGRIGKGRRLVSETGPKKKSQKGKRKIGEPQIKKQDAKGTTKVFTHGGTRKKLRREKRTSQKASK